MTSGQEYIVTCWHCGGSFDAIEAPFCHHSDPTKICPFCIKCFCDAPRQYKDSFIKNSPRDLLEEKMILQGGGDFKLGSLLVKAGKITKIQLDQAVEEQKTGKKRLGEVLKSMGLITEGELQMALTDQNALETINLKNFEVNPLLIDKLGKEFCLQFRMVPIECVQTGREVILRLAVSTRHDFFRLKSAPQLEPFVLIPYLADPVQIQNLLEEIKDEEMFILK